MASQRKTPKLFALGFSATFNMRLPHQSLRRLLLSQPGERKIEEAEDTSLLSDGQTRKLYMSLLTSRWLGFSHVAMDSCKGDWKM